MTLPKLGTRFCRVRWRDLEPYIEVGHVTKVLKTSWHIDGRSHRSGKWHRHWVHAIDREYEKVLFNTTDPSFCRQHTRHEVRESAITCILKLRRLQRRLFAHLFGKIPP